MDVLRRIDRAWARAEGWLTVSVLILMVLVAGFQALVRNLSRYEVAWATQMLADMDWGDSFLRKATLWLAFLGASLAAHRHKHIGIDILIRLAPAKPRYVMLAIGGILTGIIAMGLTKSFSDAVYLNLTERPIEYEMLGESGSMHVCDASDAEIAELIDFERPTTFCAMRAVVNAFGVPAETPGAAFQIIVPIMLFVIGFRFFAYGIGFGLVVAKGPEEIARREAEERRRSELREQETADQAAAVSQRPPPPTEGGAA